LTARLLVWIWSMHGSDSAVHPSIQHQFAITFLSTSGPPRLPSLISVGFFFVFIYLFPILAYFQIFVWTVLFICIFVYSRAVVATCDQTRVASSLLLLFFLNRDQVFKFSLNMGNTSYVFLGGKIQCPNENNMKDTN
jgi:hypothetical protein